MKRPLVAVLVLLVVLAAGIATVLLGSRWVISLVTEKAGPAPVRRVGEAMPDFELVDLQGRTWRLADFRGKTAFVNVWATWCAPCREELPHLQRLYDRVKDRPDVVLLTMNVDEKAPAVRPFVTRNAYTFPVLPAYDYVRKTLATTGIPRNWVIDADGVWRFDEVGYRAGRGDWVAHAERMIEEAGTRTGPSQHATGS
jgi:thiol-disulfide isomerase/thioredoxin